jgi:hypothetical protein
MPQACLLVKLIDSALSITGAVVDQTAAETFQTTLTDAIKTCYKLRS